VVQTNLLLDDRLSGANTALAPNREVLYAAAWIVGEYSEYASRGTPHVATASRD